MKLKSNQILWAIALFFILFSCTETDSEKPLGEYEQGVLIMNEGAFGSNDGEIYHLTPSTEVLKKDIFETVNNRPFAGLLEDMVLEADRMYLVANTGKVEIVNPVDFKSLGTVAGDLNQPRSLAVNGNKLFISDYGPYDANYNTPESYIAVVSGLDGGTVSKKIPVSRKPEDLFSYGKYILVAGSEEGKVEIIDAEKEEVTKTIDVEGKPSVFFESNGKVWLYAVNVNEVIFYSLQLDNFTLATTNSYPVSNATGKIAIGNNDITYLLTSSGWPNYEDGIAKVSISGSVLEPAWYAGSGFYGIGFDKLRGEVYLANANGFQGNGTVSILNESGTELRSFEVGRGPSGFMMR